MSIEKLQEFARDGQKDINGLSLLDGFPVTRKPARQWFNWLFNVLTLKINEVIDEMLSGSIFASNVPITKSGQRQVNVTYTNPSSQKHLYVNISLYSTALNSDLAIYLNGEFFCFIYVGQASFIVPPLSEYRINYSGPVDDISILVWSEM